MKSTWTAIAIGAFLAIAVPGAIVMPQPVVPVLIYADQGSDWTPATRAEFYRQQQGSQLIKLGWLQGLLRADGQPFLQDRLARYGYLVENSSDVLPIGFTVSGSGSGSGPDQVVGMTCAACHTREISVGPQRYRIDGGPALVDFQALLTDLDRAVGEVLASDSSFEGFAQRVLGPGATVEGKAMLRQDVTFWYRRQHALFARALPVDPWGIGRLDAVSMIIDRVSGLDIGTTPDGIIERNIYAADAPVRYPFIWDAPKQDQTQWPGFASNGDSLLALARNLGEVYGVFADFRPHKSVIGWDFHTVNSANFHGLAHAETLIGKIGAPKWPWPVDPARRDRGATLFQANCAACHGVTSGSVRLVPLSSTWKTPVVDVGTDQRQYDVLARDADTGVLHGAVYKIGHQLQPRDKQFNILAAAVIGSVLDNLAHHGVLPEMFGNPFAALPRHPAKTIATAKSELNGVYDTTVTMTADAAGVHRYEARVLHGIWSAAPYLHDGSVATLWDLLQPAESRQPSFAIGPAYDPKLVGLAKNQPGPSRVRITTGCANIKSGNSRCGHEYGAQLPIEQKKDLLEYLKTI